MIRQWYYIRCEIVAFEVRDLWSLQVETAIALECNGNSFEKIDFYLVSY